MAPARNGRSPAPTRVSTYHFRVELRVYPRDRLERTSKATAGDNMSVRDMLANTFMRTAARIALPTDKDWIAAMEAEVFHAPASSDRFWFALGCFRGVACRRASSPLFRAAALQLAMVFALLSIGTFGVWWSTKLNADIPRTVLVAAGLVYAGAGILAALSVKVMRDFACCGALGAALASSYFFVSAPRGIPHNYLAAISLEAAGLLFAVFLASALILQLRAAKRGT